MSASGRATQTARSELASCAIAAVALLLVMPLRLLPALLAGLLVYELVHLLAPLLERRFSSERARLFALALLAGAVVALIAALVFAAVAFLRSDAGSMPALFQKLAEIVEGSRASLPAWVLENLPSAGASGDDLRTALVHWLRSHAGEVQLVGRHTLLALAHILVGMVIGAIVSLHQATMPEERRPLARALAERAARLAESFRRIVFAQVRISAINTAFTALYLAVALPLFGVELPLAKSLVALTFITGLLPVIGNLISNTVIVVVSMAHSPTVALASLGYLIVIHKLEYFLNARIVGARIHAHAWELLLAMLTMEAAFGLAGVVAAPIYYAYLKDELTRRELV
jgi:predicted PurR-regulated permease PerM